MKHMAIACFALLALFAMSASAGEQARAPIINPVGGEYPLNQEITVTIRAEPGAVVIYTLDGSFPENGRGIRSESSLAVFILPPGDVTVKAVAVQPGRTMSHTRVARFTRSG